MRPSALLLGLFRDGTWVKLRINGGTKHYEYIIMNVYIVNIEFDPSAIFCLFVCFDSLLRKSPSPELI